jgi:hypothetical protein
MAPGGNQQMNPTEWKTELVDRLEEIRDEMLELVGEAHQLVRGSPEQQRAEAYWIGHIKGALNKEQSGYLGGSMIDMTETIESLRAELEPEADPDEEMVNRADIEQLFAHLRTQGFVAEMNAACCNTCSMAALRDRAEHRRPVAFTHEQNEDAFDGDGTLLKPLHIGFFLNDDGAAYAEEQAVGKRVVAAARVLGLDVEWTEDPNTKVAILAEKEPS